MKKKEIIGTHRDFSLWSVFLLNAPAFFCTSATSQSEAGDSSQRVITDTAEVGWILLFSPLASILPWWG